MAAVLNPLINKRFTGMAWACKNIKNVGCRHTTKGRKMGRKRKRPTIKRISNLPGEEWALVKGTEDFYISNLGRFKRVTAKGDSLRKVSIDPEGYCRVNIGHNKLRLHRLVAEAFLPNPDNLPVVDHIDAD